MAHSDEAETFSLSLHRSRMSFSRMTIPILIQLRREPKEEEMLPATVMEVVFSAKTAVRP